MNIKKDDLVAVFGTLKQGFGNHRLIHNCEYLGEDLTSPNYTMFSFGGFPGLLEEGNTAIHIEVYKVDLDETGKRLDYLEGYPEFYNRKLIDTKYGKAWIYYNPTNTVQDRHIINQEIKEGIWL